MSITVRLLSATARTWAARPEDEVPKKVGKCIQVGTVRLAVAAVARVEECMLLRRESQDPMAPDAAIIYMCPYSLEAYRPECASSALWI